MENNQKPEWFELAENDQPVSRPLKSKKSAPMRNLAFILAGILVIPMGAGVALLTHDSKSANAVETMNLTQDSPAATSSAQTMPSNAITMPTASRDDDDDEEGEDDDDRAPIFSSTSSTPTTVATPVAAQVAPLAPVATTKTSVAKKSAVITPPASSASKDIILPPTKKAGDDDDDDDDDDDEEDDD